MASYDFGLDGYLCRMTPSDKGFDLAVWDERFSDEVLVTGSVKKSDLIPGVRPDDRAQVEQLFRPLIDEADEKRDKRLAEERKKAADREVAERTAARESAAEARRVVEGTQVAKDGTAINMNVGENPGKPVDKSDDGSTSNAHSVSKEQKEELSSGTGAAADAAAQGEQNAQNATRPGASK